MANSNKERQTVQRQYGRMQNGGDPNWDDIVGETSHRRVDGNGRFEETGRAAIHDGGQPVIENW